jgi:hypothetical protein
MNRTMNFLTGGLLGSLLLLSGSAAQALSVSATANALGIDWTISATDSVAPAYAANYEVMFSVRADVPTDLTLLMDEGETITPTWIATAEARIAGLENFKLVSAPNGVGGWLDKAGPSANDCKGTSGGSACAESTSDAASADITSDASHIWTWVGNVKSLDLVFAEDRSGLKHIGAHLENTRHRNGWNVSEGNFGSTVPEPSAALVFGLGIAVASMRVRRTDHSD